MNGFTSVLKREIRSYFSTPLAYVFLIAFLLVSGYWTFRDGFYELRQADLRLFFGHMPQMMLFLVPAIAMRLWAEERRANTIELLFTLPITTAQAVLGKFFAAWIVLAIALALTFPMIVTVYFLGQPDPGPIWTGYIGSLLLAGTYLTIGSFFSALTRNQVVAFILGVGVCCIGLYAGSPAAVRFVAGWSPQAGAAMGKLSFMETLSFQSHFESLQRGVLEIKDLGFFLLLLGGGLWANIVLLEERKGA